MIDNRRILVVGGDSMIGRALCDRLSRFNEEVIETTREERPLGNGRIYLDLSGDISSWRPPSGITACFICASVNSLEECRKRPLETRRVNVDNTFLLAQKLIDKGVFIVFPSTNLVYDGSVPFQKADAPLCPQTEHGRQKAESERRLLALGRRVSVIRFTKVLGRHVPLFQEWIASLQSGRDIHPLSDKVLSPLPLDFIVEVLRRIAKSGLGGVLQVSAEKDVSYSYIGYKIAGALDADPGLVKPRKLEDSGLRLESNPLNTTLEAIRLLNELDMRLPGVDESLDLIIRQNINMLAGGRHAGGKRLHE